MSHKELKEKYITALKVADEYYSDSMIALEDYNRMLKLYLESLDES